MLRRGMILVLASALVAPPLGAAGAAGASNFALVNGAGSDMSSVAIRRYGSQEWRPLNVAPPAGARGAVEFSDPDCAFDIRADLGGGKSAVWSGVNLCETSAVTLKRDEQGTAWVEYD